MSGALTLKATTKMPLSERFKMLRQRAPQVNYFNQADGQFGSRLQPSQVGHASQRNRLLTQQLASRHSAPASQKIKRTNIKQRLGAPVSTPLRRLGRPAPLRRPFQALHVAQPRQVGRGRPVRLNRGSLIGTQRATAPVASKSSISQRNKLIVHQRPGPLKIKQNKNFAGGMRQQLKQGVVRPATVKPRFVRKQNMQGKRNQLIRHQQQPKVLANKRFGQKVGTTGKLIRGASNGKFATNVRGKQQGKKKFVVNKKPSKDQLDTDLDKYMAKTRTSLNGDLDAYMSQV